IPHEEKQVGSTHYTIQRWHDDSHFYKKITVTDPLLQKPAEYTEQVAKFSFGDFTEMLAYQEMQVQEVFGDYQLGKYDIRKTPRMIIIASKNSSEKVDVEKRIYSDGRTTDALT
ncbi:MAG TPA: hypothetical protein VF476_02790, partial [Chitinophagaceae bacterium]